MLVSTLLQALEARTPTTAMGQHPALGPAAGAAAAAAATTVQRPNGPRLPRYSFATGGNNGLLDLDRRVWMAGGGVLMVRSTAHAVHAVFQGRLTCRAWLVCMSRINAAVGLDGTLYPGLFCPVSHTLILKSCAPALPMLLQLRREWQP